MTTRYERGITIADSCIVRKVEGSVLWKVESQSHPGQFYNVVEREEGLTCDCPDFAVRNEVCKHCYAVMVRTGGIEEDCVSVDTHRNPERVDVSNL